MRYLLVESKSCRNCKHFQLGYGFGYNNKKKGSGPRIYEECVFQEYIIKDCKKYNFKLWEKISDK